MADENLMTDKELLELVGRQWRRIETAPKDGSAILLLAKAYTQPPAFEGEAPMHHPARCHIGCWNEEATSWTDMLGGFEGEICKLSKTGVWFSGGGWFQPNEVTHWMPLPAPPEK